MAVVGHGRDGLGDGDRAAGQNTLDVALLACRKPNASNEYEVLQTSTPFKKKMLYLAWMLGCHSRTTGSRTFGGLR
jgi:hypothetical protein